MAKGPQGAIPVAPSLCSFAGPSWRFRLGPQEMNLSAATLLSQSVETLPPPIPTCHSHDCKLADPRKLPGPSTSQRWDCLPSNQARIRGIEHPQLLSLQPSLRGCLQSLALVLNLMNEPQIVPQRPDGRTVGDPRPPTPTSQTRRPTPYSGPAGGSERHPVFASERMPLADGPARSASLADPVQVLPQLDHGWNVGTSQ